MIDAATLRNLKATYLNYRRAGAGVVKATALTCQKYPEHIARVRDLAVALESYGEPFSDADAT